MHRKLIAVFCIVFSMSAMSSAATIWKYGLTVKEITLYPGDEGTRFPTAVITFTDASIRYGFYTNTTGNKQMLAMLIAAKASGAPVDAFVYDVGLPYSYRIEGGWGGNTTNGELYIIQMK